MAVSIFGFGQPEPLILNHVTGAAFAFSLRKLNSQYFGPAVRVRRSSDNAEQDIYFSGHVFDWSAFAAFVGGGTGYVVTLYDQSGNGRNFTQSTASMQHSVVATSALAAMPNFHAGASTGGYKHGVYTMQNFNFTYLGVFRNTALYKGALFGSEETPGYSYLSIFPDEGLYYHGDGTGANSNLNLGATTYEIKRVLAAVRQGPGTYYKLIYDRGTLVAGPGDSNFRTTSFTPRVGASYAGFEGHWGEMIVYDTPLNATQINKIHTNQMAFYAIS